MIILKSSIPKDQSYDFTIDKSQLNFLEIKELAQSIHNNFKKTLYISIHKLSKSLHHAFLNILLKHLYTFEKYKTNSTQKTSKKIYVITSNNLQSNLYKLNYINTARNLANEPGNIVYPESFCNIVKNLFKTNNNIKVKILNEKQILNLNMNLLHAVGKGSVHPPRVMIIELPTTQKNAKNIVMIGKGITFDTGGYNLKPSQYMETMHGDKTGGSIVVATLKYLAAQKSRKNNYIGIIPLAENMVSSKAYKVGDIFKSYSGKTVEIGDTDKEGRLLLADSLAYACDKYKPDLLLDVATLTGWASMLHCDISFNYFTLNEKIADKMNMIQNKTGEKSIRLPPWIEYRKFTKSKVADLTTYGSKDCSRNEGFMATMFLSNFVSDKYLKNWIHIDIAHHELNNLMNCNSMASIIELVC